MGLLSNKISRDDLKPGDHIYSWRAYIYSHHGIYIGDGKVIHFTRGGGLEIGTRTFLNKIIVSSVPNHRSDNPCPNCGYQSNLGGVISSCLDCFLAGGKLYLFKYSVSKAIFLAKQRGGTCTMAPSDPSDEVIYRAKLLLSIKNGFGPYNLFENNCEDFAIYCKTGLVVLSITKLGISSQANWVSATGGIFSSTLRVLGVGKGKSGQAAPTVSPALVTAAKVVISTTVGFAGITTGFGAVVLAGYGKYCIGRLNSDIGVRKDVIKVPVDELVLIIALHNNNNNSNKCKTS